MLKKIILILFILTISSNAFSEELSRNRARQIRITDTGDYFVSTQVEGALQELGAVGGESTTVTDTTTINLTLTGSDITADGLYTAGDYITLTGADFDVDNMLNTITTPDAEVTAGLGITFADTGIMTITEAADTITFDATEVDGSTSNEINTVQGDDNTATTGLAISIDGAGIVTTDVIGDVLTITGTEAQGLSAITTIDATTTDDVTVGDFVMSDGNPWAGWADTDTNTGYIIHWESGDTYPFGLWGVTFTASAPSVSPNTPIWWVNSSNDFNVSGNGASVPSFTVARATGNVSVTNDLTVSGTTTLTGTLTVDSNTVNLSDTTDEYVLAFDTGTQTWRGVVATAGDLLADGSIPLTADWDAGNSLYDITAVEFKGALIGNADTVTNATLTTALTVNTGTLTLAANAGNNSVLTIGANAVSVSGANTGDNTVATTGDSATDFFSSGEIVDARISDTLTSSTCTGNAGTVTNGVYTTDNISVIAASSSAQLYGVINDETGSAAGSPLAVFNQNPTIASAVLTGNIDAGGSDLEIPQGQTPDTDGEINWDITDGTLQIQQDTAHAELASDTILVAGKMIKSWSATLAFPDALQAEQDTWMFKQIDATEFPHGVVIVEILLSTPAASTYALNVENWDDPDTINGANPTIDAIATSASQEAVETAITYGTIAAGQIIKLDLDTDDVAEIHVEIFYYEPIA